MDVLKSRLVDAMERTNSLAANLSSDGLKSHNGAAPSNAIGAQFWCVVGARESYARAFQAGAWQGFACSLKDIARQKLCKARWRSLRQRCLPCSPKNRLAKIE